MEIALPDVPVTVVVGAQWGDEGKAKVIDLLSKEHGYVVRYQGGHNAGHTVVVGGERYALQLTPSGILYDHVIPVIANGVVVDLPTLFAEIDTLSSRGISCERLRVSSLAHLVFPWHQAHDAIAEAMRGEDKIGTTLKGIGPAYADKARRVGIRAGEVLDPKRFAEHVRTRAVAENRLITGDGGEALDVDEIVDTFSALGARLAPYVTDTVSLLHDALATGAHVLLEGAQATFLDLDHGTYPYVTSSNPTAGGACAGTGLGPRDIDRVVGITKAYTTRVGAGPFPTELTDETATASSRSAVSSAPSPDVGVVPAGSTASCCARPFGSTASPNWRSRSSTCSTSFETVKVCTDYLIDGRTLTAYPDRADLLARVEPVYETLHGLGRGTPRDPRGRRPARRRAAAHRARRTTRRRVRAGRRRGRRTRRLLDLAVRPIRR